MKELSKKNGLRILLLIAICVTLITGLGTTYAFFVYRGNGSNVSVEAGDLNVTFTNDNNYLTTGNSYPVSDETGKVLPYYSDFSVNATTNNMGIKYEIQIVPDANNSINPQYIKLYLTDQFDNPLTNVLNYSNLSEAEYNENAKLVYTNYITETGTKDFRLRMWIDESYALEEGQTFGFKIYLYAINEKKPNYLADKIEETLTLTDDSADIDVTRYVNGQVDNNYVWYSGKLWRIVSINSDGVIKMVTQGNMTTLSWDIYGGTDYSTSQIRTWLNNEFLPTLVNADNLLVDSVWDYATYSSFPNQKSETLAPVTNKVGLLNVYEYMKTGGTNNSDTSSTFLNNGYYWWTISPQTADSNVWCTSSNGHMYFTFSLLDFGVRPSVNLKSDVKIIGGEGIKSNPYLIEGDKAIGKSTELISSRLSGEYINFNNTLYRIVGIEEIDGVRLTKVTMADYRENKNGNTLTTSFAFDSSGEFSTYSPTYGIGLYLENWYQADSTSETYATTYINDTYKSMIATPNEDKVVWYTGPASSSRDYTVSKTGNEVSSIIGLGYYGEMFSSQFGDGSNVSSSTWLMTEYTDSYAWYVDNDGKAGSFSVTEAKGVRPSFYLKPNVKITGGTGMPNNPYTISQ